MPGLPSNKESLEYTRKGRFILLIFFVIHFYVDAGFNHYSGIKHLRDGVKNSSIKVNRRSYTDRSECSLSNEASKKKLMVSLAKVVVTYNSRYIKNVVFY